MVQALENASSDTSTLEFFGLRQQPFSRLSHPSQVFHTEQYSLLMTHLASATQQSDNLVVICGADGCGKTTLLSRYMSSLSEDNCFAAIDETCTNDIQFYCAVLRHLGFGDITGTTRELRRIAKEYLINRAMAGETVLLIVDNAHLVNPKVLEQLRWLAAIKIDEVRVVSIILAGNADLIRIINSPAMSQLVFRTHVRFHIRAYTQEETANYVWHHLKLAEADDELRFSSEAHALIHRYTGGIPGQINKLCTSVLAEAHAQKTHVISEELLRKIADNSQLLPHVTPLQGKGRRKTDPDFKLAQAEKAKKARQKAEANAARQRAAPARAAGKQQVGPGDAENDASIEQLADGIAEGAESDTAGIPILSVKNLMEKIAELSQEIGELSADRRRLGDDIAARDTSITELRQKLEEQSSKNQTLTTSLGSHDSQLEALERSLAEKTEALQTAEELAKQLSGDLKDQKRAAKKALKDLAKTEATNEKFADQQAELQATIEQLTADLESANEQIGKAGDLGQTVLALKKEIEAKAGELYALRDALDGRKVALGEVTKRLEESQQECAELQSRDDTAKQQAEELQSELAVRQERIAALEQELESRDANESERSEQTKALEAELEASRDRITALEAELESLKAAETERAEQSKAMEADLKASHDNIVSLERELEAREDNRSEQAEALANDLKASEERIAALQTELEALNAANDERSEQAQALEAELNASRERIAGLESEIESHSAAEKERSEQAQALEAELEESREKIAALASEAQSRDAADKEHAEQTRALESELKATQTKVASLEKELASREDNRSEQAKALANDLKASEDKLASLVKELESRVAADDERAEQAQALERDLEASREKIASLEQELESRSAELESRAAEADGDGEAAALRSELAEAAERLAEAEAKLEDNENIIARLEDALRSAPRESEDDGEFAADAAADGEGSVINAFEILREGELEQMVELMEGPWRIMVGRGDDNELLLDSEFVSRHHAMISSFDGEIYIEDLNSFNGTIINSQVVTRSRLKVGDVVMIGDFQLKPIAAE